MRFVIQGLKYDTDKMKKIANVKKWYKTNEDVGQLVEVALADLKRIGVHSSYLDEADIKDPLIIEAVLLYCHANFGSPDNQTQLLASYDAMCTKIKGGGYHREANKTID